MPAPTPKRMAADIDSLLLFLLNKDIALLINPVSQHISKDPVSRGLRRITWISPFELGESFIADADHRVAGYKSWISAGQYSALLSDGALLQITYDYLGRDLVGHRLAYIPCPFVVDQRLLESDPILDVIDMHADTEGVTGIVLRGMVRFDFDPEAEEEDHPSSHLTLISADCRIPCLAPVSLGHFIEFVFKHFYPSVWRSYAFLRELPKESMGDQSVTSYQTNQLHVAWASKA